MDVGRRQYKKKRNRKVSEIVEDEKKEKEKDKR